MSLAARGTPKELSWISLHQSSLRILKKRVIKGTCKAAKDPATLRWIEAQYDMAP